MSSPDIQYKYALSEAGEVICIDALTEKDRIDYECLGCGNILRPVLGEIRQKHFRHKFQPVCSEETYLHRMGKKLFMEKYKECLLFNIPYLLELEVPIFCNSCQHGPCSKDGRRKSYNLTDKFIKIKEEQRDQNLIPDILLETESGEKIYIEIAVTHSSSISKIASGKRIIEFLIKEETDLEILKSNQASMFNDKIRVYNFKPQPETIHLKRFCHKEIDYFAVFSNGKCRFVTCQIYKWDVIKESGRYVVKVEDKNPDIFIQETEKAFLAGIRVKNCFLCRYHAINTFHSMFKESNPIFCKFYREQKKSNFAADCKIYRPDKKVFRYSKSNIT